MASIFSVGKIPPEILKEVVFKRCGVPRREVLLYPQVGEDTSVLDAGGELLVVSTDPITGAVDRAGWLAIKVALNDIGAAGAEPICVLVTLLLPEGTGTEDLRRLVDEIHRACLEENVAVAGGHSEVTPGLSRPIISVTALGKTRGRKVLSASGAKEGDDIVLTKWAGMEGAAILARDFREILARKLELRVISEAAGLLDFVSVTKDGRIALESGATGCHDATEGGVLGAIYEVCEASGKGALVYSEKIPVHESTSKIASVAGIEPLRLVSSGCLVVTTGDGQGLCDAYGRHGINARVVGKITSGERQFIMSGKTFPLEAPKSDELWRARKCLERICQLE